MTDPHPTVVIEMLEGKLWECVCPTCKRHFLLTGCVTSNTRLVAYCSGDRQQLAFSRVEDLWEVGDD